MSYVEEVYAGLEAKHPNEPEFLEAAKRVLDSSLLSAFRGWMIRESRR